MDEWISKKDLLQVTGISYGQLYRWKREKLIPDSWFDKRSAYTGQETFFPRELILARIQFILENKDKYSLAQLQQQLSPSGTSRTYSLEKLASLEGTEPAAKAMYELTGKEEVDQTRALTVLIVARVMHSCPLTSEDARELTVLLTQWQARHSIFAETDARLVLVEFGGQCLPMFLKPEASILLPDQAKEIFSLSMNELSGDLLRLSALCEEE